MRMILMVAALALGACSGPGDVDPGPDAAVPVDASAECPRTPDRETSCKRVCSDGLTSQRCPGLDEFEDLLACEQECVCGVAVAAWCPSGL